MCDNLSSGPAEMSDRTMRTTCMHNLCERFLRKQTGPKAGKGCAEQDRNADFFCFPIPHDMMEILKIAATINFFYLVKFKKIYNFLNI